LIESRREGQFVYSRAIPETITEFARALTRMSHGRKSTGGD